MRIIIASRLDEYGKKHPQARAGLEHWREVAEEARWRSLAETRASFPHADEVRVSSGRTVTVFNIRKNDYRLITAIHYRGGRVYIREFLTHAEYDKDHWKTRH